MVYKAKTNALPCEDEAVTSWICTGKNRVENKNRCECVKLINKGKGAR
jgi:hypothetical protein